MESDDDFELLPSPPIHERKLKRLKKATRAHENPRPSTPPANSPESLNDAHLNLSNGVSGPEIESLGDDNVTVEEEGLGGAKRVLEFDSLGDELDGKVTEEGEEVRDLNKTDELERKRRSIDDHSENQETKKKKKKKRIDDGDGGEKKLKEAISNKRKAEKVHIRFSIYNNSFMLIHFVLDFTNFRLLDLTGKTGKSQTTSS